jgi:hypothetical protein
MRDLVRIRKVVEAKKVSNVVRVRCLFTKIGSVGQSTIENICRSVGVVPKS